MAMLSMLGLYRANEHIFDDMILPTQIDDRESFFNNLLMDVAEMEVLYTDADFMQFAIKNWSKKQIITWQKLADAFDLEFNPLYNVDAYEEHTIEREGYDTDDNKETRNLTSQKTDSFNNYKETTTRNLENEHTENNPNLNITNNQMTRVGKFRDDDSPMTTTEYVSGFNSNTMQPNKKTEQVGATTEEGASREYGKRDDIDHSITNDTTEHEFTGTKNENIADGGTIKNENRNDFKNKEIQVDRRYGNIGVTKSTELMRDYLDVEPLLNIQNYIIREFKQRFCLGVY